MVASWQEALALVEPEEVDPQFDDSEYLAFIVQQPGVFDNKLFT